MITWARCWPWSHKWSKWENHGTVKHYIGSYSNPNLTFEVGTDIVQQRYCQVCNKLQCRRVTQ